MGELRILSSQGDTKVIWNPDNKDEARAAEDQYDSLIKKNFLSVYCGVKGFINDVEREKYKVKRSETLYFRAEELIYAKHIIPSLGHCENKFSHAPRLKLSGLIPWPLGRNRVSETNTKWVQGLPWGLIPVIYSN